MRIKKILFRCKILIILFSFSCNIFSPVIIAGSTKDICESNSRVKLKSSGQLSFSVAPKNKQKELKKEGDSFDKVNKIDAFNKLNKLNTSADIKVKSASEPKGTSIDNVGKNEKTQVDSDVKNADEEEKIVFNFEDVDLVNVAAYIESLYNVKFLTDEVITPLVKGGKALSGNKVSFKTQKPMSKDQAWGLFLSFLNMAGFALVPMGKLQEGKQFYRIEVIKSAKRSAIPVYINIDSEKLPDNDQIIRYGYFVKDCPLDTIRNVLDSLKSREADLLILHDHKAFIITDKSYNIKVLMKIVKELDKVTMPQSMSVLKLYKVDAAEVEMIYTKLVSEDEDGTVATRLFGPQGPSKALYFPKKTKMIVEKRTNSLILLGTAEDIKTVEEFIKKFIDIDVTTPYSPLHIYDLKYADAINIANIMNNLVQFGGEKKGGLRGGDKYFKNMKFIAEKEGNRLIIRGDYDDYLKAKEVLDEIDEPPIQVAIEVLILGITVEDKRELGAQIRNKFLSPDGSRLNFQTSGITLGSSAKGIVPNTEASAIGSLRLLGDLISLVTGAVAGNTVISLGSDRYGVWGIFGILDKLTNTQIISNPFLTATNNTTAKVRLGTTKRIVSSFVQGSGDPTKSFSDNDAFMEVTVTPKINSESMIVMDLIVEFNNFVGTSAEIKNKRKIATSIVAANDEVLALGGLLKDKKEDAASKVPVLADIPVLGWFFKNKKKVDTKDDLLVLITPHIVKQGEDIKEYTKRHIKDYKDTLQEGDVVVNPKDPIDRSFFKEKTREFDLKNFIFKRGKTNDDFGFSTPAEVKAKASKKNKKKNKKAERKKRRQEEAEKTKKKKKAKVLRKASVDTKAMADKQEKKKRDRRRRKSKKKKKEKVLRKASADAKVMANKQHKRKWDRQRRKSKKKKKAQKIVEKAAPAA